MSTNLAQVAMSEAATLNRKVIDPVPEKMLKTGDPIYIFNVGPWRHARAMGSLGTYTVLECPKGAKYSAPLEIPYVVRETVPHESSNWKMGNRFEDGMDVAIGILGEGPFQSAQHGIGRLGVFIAADSKPTDAELKQANDRLNAWYDSQIAEADAFWNQGPNHYASIVAEHRDAATARGVQREWLKPIKESVECPGCGERINPNMTVHTGRNGCGRIINKAKYEQEKREGMWHVSPA